MTRFRLAVAAPHGDIDPTDADLDLVLEGNPDGVTYRAYFAALTEFLRGEAGEALAALAAETLGPDLPAPAETVVRAEKHGALYHPASVEMVFPDGRRFLGGVLAASTPLARAVLANEAGWMNRLRERLGEPLLPRVLAASGDGPLALALVEWFAGFCEFHLDASGAVQLWDFGRGVTPLAPAQARDLYGRAGYILGRCYDPASGGRVFPWHHAAGDFVARPAAEGGDRMDVRLTTVRDYGPAQDPEDGAADPLAAFAAFVLETTLRLRLDRVDGVGEAAWLPADCMEAGLSGVLAGVAEQPDPAADLAAETCAVLADFSRDDLLAALAAAAADCGPFYAEILQEKLPQHADELAAALTACRL
ncbi:MAG: hypothetical protein AB1916_02745 [Thermodesulfobacteriota bacterium]